MYADNQNDITRLVVRSAQLLLAYGADSDLVEELSQRLGKALGLASVELSISSNALVLTSLVHGRCITTTRRIRAHGVYSCSLAGVLEGEAQLRECLPGHRAPPDTGRAFDLGAVTGLEDDQVRWFC